MTATHGDDQLANRLHELLGSRHPVAAAAVLSPAGVTVAGVGASLDADFEIGSISKGITRLLYVDALERGEIGADTTLGDLLQLGDVPAAGVTLASLSTHRSGLPRLPRSAAPSRRTLALWPLGLDVFYCPRPRTSFGPARSPAAAGRVDRCSHGPARRSDQQVGSGHRSSAWLDLRPLCSTAPPRPQPPLIPSPPWAGGAYRRRLTHARRQGATHHLAQRRHRRVP
ncbi:MAG: serine hydrolase [Jiangellaceae bacterium]